MGGDGGGAWLGLAWLFGCCLAAAAGWLLLLGLAWLGLLCTNTHLTLLPWHLPIRIQMDPIRAARLRSQRTQVELVASTQGHATEVAEAFETEELLVGRVPLAPLRD